MSLGATCFNCDNVTPAQDVVWIESDVLVCRACWWRAPSELRDAYASASGDASGGPADDILILAAARAALYTWWADHPLESL